MALRLFDRHAGDSLELLDLLVLRLLQLLLQLADVGLPVGHALLPARDVRQPPLDLLFPRMDSLLGSCNAAPAVLRLVLGFGAEANDLLAGVDLRLATDRLGLPLCLLQL